jgi:hypothetical protein
MLRHRQGLLGLLSSNPVIGFPSNPCRAEVGSETVLLLFKLPQNWLLVARLVLSDEHHRQRPRFINVARPIRIVRDNLHLARSENVPVRPRTIVQFSATVDIAAFQARGPSLRRSMAQISEYSIVTYQRKPGHRCAAITPKARSENIVPAEVRSVVTPDDHESESEGELAAEKVIKILMRR